RARRVYLYAFGGRAVDVWWTRHRAELTDIDNLVVRVLDPEATTALAATVERGMRISCTLEDGQLWFSDASGTVAVGITTLHGAG
ncbi:MAG: YaeQ family protein, partial [Halothiobacillaceae bacterium]|nr:YaeQ family protein [Halothiobacillaceae bacterium]